MIPPTTSASQLTTYSLCPRKYALTYVLDAEPEWKSTSLLLGSAIHSAVGWWFEEWLAGRLPTIAEAENVLAADLAAGAAGTNVRWKTASPDSLEADGRRYLGLYLLATWKAPVVHVEAPFQVDLVDDETGQVFGRPLKGFFDLVLRDDRVIELKTSSRGWTEFETVRHLQLGAYAHAWNTLHGGPSKVEAHVIVKAKREPRVDTFKIERGEAESRWFLEAAGAIEAAIAAEHFPPSPSMLCVECEFERRCASWTRAPETRVGRRLPVLESAVLTLHP